MDSEQHLRTRSCIYQHGRGTEQFEQIDVFFRHRYWQDGFGAGLAGRKAYRRENDGFKRPARTREPDRLAPRSRSRTRKNLRVHGGQWRLSGGRRPISPRRRIPGQRSQSEADQRVRCESAPTCVDRRCRCGLNCSLRSAGRPKGVGTAFSGGEPTSGAYKSSTGSEEREDPYSKSTG